MGQLHNNRWFEITNFSTIINRLPAEQKLPICYDNPLKRMIVWLVILSNLTLATQKSTDKIRAYPFWRVKKGCLKFIR